MRLLLLGLLFMSLSIQANLPHEFHFSKCQIEYKTEEEAIQITMNLFIDDLEIALEKRGHKSLFLGSEREHPDATKYLLDYLQSSFQVAINDTEVTYDFIGKETSEDLSGLWCYFELTSIEELRSIDIKNATLTEIYDDQKNVVQVKGPYGKKGYFLLNKQNKTQRLEF